MSAPDLDPDVASRVEETPELELMAPVKLNIVCFRYRCEDVVIRAALFNHRTCRADVDALVEQAVATGAELDGGAAPDA